MELPVVRHWGIHFKQSLSHEAEQAETMYVCVCVCVAGAGFYEHHIQIDNASTSCEVSSEKTKGKEGEE